MMREKKRIDIGPSSQIISHGVLPPFEKLGLTILN